MYAEIYNGEECDLEGYNKKYSVNGKPAFRPMMNVLKEIESKFPLNIDRKEGEFRKFVIDLLVKEYDELPYKVSFNRSVTVFELLFVFILVHSNKKEPKWNEELEEIVMKIICGLVVDKANISHINQYNEDILKIMEILQIKNTNIVNLVKELINEIQKN
jgi:hypothetical protein